MLRKSAHICKKASCTIRIIANVVGINEETGNFAHVARLSVSDILQFKRNHILLKLLFWETALRYFIMTIDQNISPFTEKVSNNLG